MTLCGKDSKYRHEEAGIMHSNTIGQSSSFCKGQGLCSKAGQQSFCAYLACDDQRSISNVSSDIRISIE